MSISCLALGITMSPALAAPKITEVIQNYAVSATTIRGLKSEFKTNGQNGFAGFTRWEVRWDAACRVEVKITYTLPNHTDPDAMPPQVRDSYFRFLKNLKSHERLHGQNGIMAGTEVKQAGCANVQPIIRKYNRADKRLDRRTKNGRSQGVTLN